MKLSREAATKVLLAMDDKELADTLEQVLLRSCAGFDESFSALLPYERLLLMLRNTVRSYQSGATR